MTTWDLRLSGATAALALSATGAAALEPMLPPVACDALDLICAAAFDDDGLGLTYGQANITGDVGTTTSTNTITPGAFYRNDSVFTGGAGTAFSVSRYADLLGAALGEGWVAGESGWTFSSAEFGVTLYIANAGFGGGPGGARATAEINGGIGLALGLAHADGAVGTVTAGARLQNTSLIGEGLAQVTDGAAVAAGAIEGDPLVPNVLTSALGVPVTAFGYARAEGATGTAAAQAGLEGNPAAATSLSPVAGAAIYAHALAETVNGTAEALTGLIGDKALLTGAARATGATALAESTAWIDADRGLAASLNMFHGETGIALTEFASNALYAMSFVENDGTSHKSYTSIDGVAISLESVVNVANGEMRTFHMIGADAYGEVFAGLGLASAVAVLNQTLDGNVVNDQGGARSTILDGAGNGGAGLISINQEAGNVNNQTNIRVIAGAAPGAPAAILTAVHGAVTTTNNTLIGGGGPRENRIDNSFNNAAGIVGVTQTTGNLNQLANVFVLGLAGPGGVALSEIDLATVNSGNAAPPEDPAARRADIVANSFNNFSGVAQIAQTTGDLNTATNILSVSVTALP